MLPIRMACFSLKLLRNYSRVIIPNVDNLWIT